MNSPVNPIIVGLGPIATEIVAPILGSDFIYIENPNPADLAVAQGALVRAAFESVSYTHLTLPTKRIV